MPGAATTVAAVPNQAAEHRAHCHRQAGGIGPENSSGASHAAGARGTRAVGDHSNGPARMNRTAVRRGEGGMTLSVPLPADNEQRISYPLSIGSSPCPRYNTQCLSMPPEPLFRLTQDYGLRLRWDPFLREMRFLDGD